MSEEQTPEQNGSSAIISLILGAVAIGLAIYLLA
jgi:hypothetical protein